MPQRTACMMKFAADITLRIRETARRIADRLHRHVAGIGERENAARAAFEPFVAPDERADGAALAEHELDVAAEVLRVQQAFLEAVIVVGVDVLFSDRRRALVE